MVMILEGLLSLPESQSHATIQHPRRQPDKCQAFVRLKVADSFNLGRYESDDIIGGQNPDSTQKPIRQARAPCQPLCLVSHDDYFRELVSIGAILRRHAINATAAFSGVATSHLPARDQCHELYTSMETIIANGRSTAINLPATIETFLLAQNLLPRSVVVEHNGEAVPPSEFSKRSLYSGDRLEIVKIVAGG